MICPRCSVADISPLTNRCELCGFSPAGGVTVEAPVDEATDALARRELADDFHFDALLGLGPDWALYVARDNKSTQQVFLKVRRRPERHPPMLDEQFRRAAELAATIEHPHIVPVLRFGITDRLHWYTMEHVRGRSLRTTLAARGALDVRSTLRIVAQVASALDHGHRQGIVHGDLRPETVLIDPDGWVRVSDILVARVSESSREAQAEPAPRPPYVAPELEGEGLRTPASDLYALGVLVYECLVGMTPGETGALESARPDLPPHVMHAVRRALRPHPADRFPSVLDFVAALETPARLGLPDARPSGRADSTILMIPDWEPPPRVYPWRAIAIVVGAVATTALAVVAWPLLARLWAPPFYDAPPRPVAAPTAPARPDTTIPSAALPAPAQPPAERRAAPSTRQSRPAAPRATGPASAPARPPQPTATREPAPAPAPALPGSIPQDPGRLFVSATPWGMLFIDGRPAGNTPKANLAIAPGTHVIRIERDGFEPVERTITVAPGQVVRLTGIVLAERQP